MAKWDLQRLMGPEPPADKAEMSAVMNVAFLRKTPQPSAD